MLLHNVFNQDDIKVDYFNKKCLLVMIIVIVTLLIMVFTIKKDYYYENIITQSDTSIILLAHKNMVNIIKRNKSILVNDIESDYSINKIVDGKNICYIDINLKTNILNIYNLEYKIFLGKETIFEYLIRIIRNV